MHRVLKTGVRKREVLGSAISAGPLALYLYKTRGGFMIMRRLAVVVVLLSLTVTVSAQTASESAEPEHWQKSVNGYIWVGTGYWGGIANAVFDDRAVLQGGVNLVLQNSKTKLIGKTWFSLSPEKDAASGKRWTGNAQELDLGLEVQRTLANGLVARVGYSHFFITKSAGSDVEMIVMAVSQQVALTDKNTLTGAFEFYQFVPTSSGGPASGRFYLPSVTFSRTSGKWTGSIGLAGAFNSKGVFGFTTEPAIRVTGQLLYKLSKGQTGPDFTYGGVPGSTQRPMRTTFGWSWVF